MASKTCPLCQMNHERLGVQLLGRVLLRHVRGNAHRLRVLGGAFGFSEKFWQAHFAGEHGFLQVQIHDQVTGEVFFADQKALERVERMTLSLEHGPQVVIPIAAMVKTRSMPRRLAPQP